MVTGLRWEDIPIGNGNLALLCDTSTGRVRPLVPASLRRKVLVWHGLSKQVRTWAKTCLDCQCAKVHGHVMAPWRRSPSPNNGSTMFTLTSWDLFHRPTPSQGYTYLFTVVDRFTIPLASIDRVLSQSIRPPLDCSLRGPQLHVLQPRSAVHVRPLGSSPTFSASSYTGPRCTTRRQTDLWNDSTIPQRPRSEPA